ncbi:putative cytochrome c biosynthesis protein [Sesamum angolense]|uniref:Cytochrome c biosynthesis protein n=1 Tax=Sesamum angolense TaxID=2727404 RepID=A0AAE1WIE5_9LAMI|nr:putative cytochrome c biosynthesis protein [Sesamum angolense]
MGGGVHRSGGASSGELVTEALETEPPERRQMRRGGTGAGTRRRKRRRQSSALTARGTEPERRAGAGRRRGLEPQFLSSSVSHGFPDMFLLNALFSAVFTPWDGRYGVMGSGLKYEPEGGVVFELRGFPLRVDVLVPFRLPNHAALFRLLFALDTSASGQEESTLSVSFVMERKIPLLHLFIGMPANTVVSDQDQEPIRILILICRWFSTIGILKGLWWGQHEIGWGGWLFRDPVENVSFMPRLLTTMQ